MKLQSKYGINAQKKILSSGTGAGTGSKRYPSSMSKGPYSYSRTNTSKELIALRDNFVKTRDSDRRGSMNSTKQRLLSSDVGLRNAVRHQSICDSRKPSALNLQKGVKDIREARTAEEVREIMAQVNDRYKNGAKYL